MCRNVDKCIEMSTNVTVFSTFLQMGNFHSIHLFISPDVRSAEQTVVVIIKYLESPVCTALRRTFWILWGFVFLLKNILCSWQYVRFNSPLASWQLGKLTIFPASWWLLEISFDLDSRKRTCLETPQKSTPNMSMVIQNKRTGQNGSRSSIDYLPIQWNHLCIFSKNLANPPVERLVSVERLVKSFWELPEKEIF